MTVRKSSSARVDALIADLASDRDIVRETAVSRLTVLGTASVEPLRQLVRNQAVASIARMGGLRALEGIGQIRGLDVILEALEDTDVTVAAAAAAAARPFLKGPRGADIVDRLTAIVLDRQRNRGLRSAALEALSDLDASTLRPLHNALKGDPDLGTIEDSNEGEAPGAIDSPEQARRAVAHAAAAASLPALQDLIARVRVHEDQSPAARKQEWTAVRGVAHAALAGRGSRLAMYDLRETVERTSQPLPLDYLLALKEIGDASCLEALAASHARVPDAWWRGQLAELFKGIAAREGLTRRHAAMKRIARRWPGIVQ